MKKLLKDASLASLGLVPLESTDYFFPQEHGLRDRATVRADAIVGA